MRKPGLSLLFAALAVPAPTNGRFLPGLRTITFDRTTGLGDIQWINYVATNENVMPPDIFGVGVGLLMKTATSELLGSGKWAAGPSAVAVHLGERWMYGVVAQHFRRLCTPSDRKRCTKDDIVRELRIETIGDRPFLSRTVRL